MAAAIQVKYPPINWNIPTTFRAGGIMVFQTAGGGAGDDQDISNYLVTCTYENDTMRDLGFAAVAASVLTSTPDGTVWQVGFYNLPTGTDGTLTATLQHWNTMTGKWDDVNQRQITGLTNTEDGAIYLIPPNGHLTPSFLVEGQCTDGHEVLCYLMKNATILAAGVIGTGTNIHEWTAQFYDRTPDNGLSLLAECWDPINEVLVASHTITGITIAP